MFVFGRLVYKPEEARFIIFGSSKENTESVVAAGNPLSQTEVIANPTAARVNDVPSAAIVDILLKVGSVLPLSWYFITASVLIPVTPEKNLPGAFAVPPVVMFNLSVIAKLGGVLSYNTVSAKKSVCNALFKEVESW